MKLATDGFDVQSGHTRYIHLYASYVDTMTFRKRYFYHFAVTCYSTISMKSDLIIHQLEVTGAIVRLSLSMIVLNNRDW